MITRLPLWHSSTRAERSRQKRHARDCPEAPFLAQAELWKQTSNDYQLLLHSTLLLHLNWPIQMVRRVGPEHLSEKVQAFLAFVLA